MYRGEEVVDFPQEELPVKLTQAPDPPDNVSLAGNFPAHVYEPAVLLTPPRQKSNSEFSPLQDGKQDPSVLMWLYCLYVSFI
jgi:spindle and centriole-associated protein 1